MDITVHSYESQQSNIRRNDSHCCCKTDQCHESIQSNACLPNCDVGLTFIIDRCLLPDPSRDLTVALWNTASETLDLEDANPRHNLTVRCRIAKKDNEVYARNFLRSIATVIVHIRIDDTIYLLCVCVCVHVCVGAYSFQIRKTSGI